jgi:ankyrin repeat protein
VHHPLTPRRFDAGRTGLHLARAAGNLEATGLLLRAGCDPDVADSQGRTVQAVVAGLCAAGEATLVRL